MCRQTAGVMAAQSLWRILGKADYYCVMFLVGGGRAQYGSWQGHPTAAWEPYLKSHAKSHLQCYMRIMSFTRLILIQLKKHLGRFLH